MRSAAAVACSSVVPAPRPTRIVSLACAGVRPRAVRTWLGLGSPVEHADPVVTDLANFGVVNEQMTRACSAPYPARATVGVKELPRGAAVEIDAVLYLG